MPTRYRSGYNFLPGRFSAISCNLGGVIYKSPVDVGTCSNLLSVRSIDLLNSKTGQNRLEHHTDLYHSDNLIVRRGQSFQIWIELSRDFDPKTDHLQLLFKLGSAPPSRKSVVTASLVSEFEGNQWEAKIIEKKHNKIKLSVFSPPTASIGRYEFSVTTRNASSQSPEKDIYLLFNPWCKNDTVFMDNQDERNEYVLNDVGLLYCGNDKQISARPWNFGQFADGILEACLFILEKTEASASGLGDPVTVSRVVSAMINSLDDQGVLQGNWSNNYVGGTAPTAWSGSVKILKQYHRSGGLPVKYGQCWVFSGVTTTVLRCFGIPTRSITNFSSAHDTDNSLTTDVYLDEEMRPIDMLNSDSIWNFHVWNDCWMARPDLPPGMGGWQAVDATPQETSQGIYCCGPAPVAAIRDGQVYLKHDTPFVFAEVNSDKIYWQRQYDGSYVKIFCEERVVGRNISTKAVGSDRRQDITHLYKYPEGSEKERIAVETAARYGSKPNTYSSAGANDVALNIALKDDQVQIGQDAHLSIILKNSTSHKRSVVLYCQAAAMYYTGVQKGIVKSDRISVNLNPCEVQELDWILPYDQYKNQLADHATLMLSVTGRVNETKQVLATQFNFRLCTPDIVIKPKGDAVVGRQMEAQIIFKNPLQCDLKNVAFHIEGLGLETTSGISYCDVGSLETTTLTVAFLPTLAGLQRLTVLLDCLELTQVHGIADIHIKNN
ncbi:protein-glutamine gamma-glutamyltransferase K-like [Neoarius graeffei]|uniref:protein-glutamine gamma-glutamyltransferase K-like n=1 Tax=Neoarius graeffei TaxID=443677 RepID=UPI00298C68A0|nr:protein-glutamine gamma-glutamyltransferase K-like [Neoarius graeffei]